MVSHSSADGGQSFAFNVDIATRFTTAIENRFESTSEQIQRALGIISCTSNMEGGKWQHTEWEGIWKDQSRDGDSEMRAKWAGKR